MEATTPPPHARYPAIQPIILLPGYPTTPLFHSALATELSQYPTILPSGSVSCYPTSPLPRYPIVL